ncbi:MAG: DNA polymerase III subunit delta [Alphaproteobacteria bacterium]|nr:DNA polymerase III subunit delta [Alphaproteobacteria bacterium]
MKIAARRIDGFLKAPPPGLRVALVYGPDRGLVKERAEALARTVVPDLADPFRVAELAPDRIARDPSLLVDEALALAFGGGRRVVRVRDAGDAIAAACATLLAETAPALVVIEAADLGPRSSLRRQFDEAPDTAVAIACYHDEGTKLGQVIDAVLAEHRVTLEPAARAYLVGALGGDRGATRAELEKLATYVGEGARAGLAEAEAVVGDSAAIGLDQVAFAVGSGDAAGLDRMLLRALGEGLEPIALLRATARHVERLHLVAGRRESGLSLAEAASGFRPPLHFRAQEALNTQASRWTTARAAVALATLLDAEVAAKTTGNPAATLVRQTLLTLAAGTPIRR